MLEFVGNIWKICTKMISVGEKTLKLYFNSNLPNNVFCYFVRIRVLYSEYLQYFHIDLQNIYGEMSYV